MSATERVPRPETTPDLAARVKQAQEHADSMPPSMSRYAHNYIRAILNGPTSTPPAETRYPAAMGRIAAMIRGEDAQRHAYAVVLVFESETPLSVEAGDDPAWEALSGPLGDAIERGTGSALEYMSNLIPVPVNTGNYSLTVRDNERA